MAAKEKEANKYAFPSSKNPPLGYAPFSPKHQMNNNMSFGSNRSITSNSSNSSIKYNIVPKKFKKKRMSLSFSRYASKPLPIVKPNVNSVKEVSQTAPTKRPAQSLFANEHKDLISTDFKVPPNATKSEMQEIRNKVNDLYDHDVVSLETFYDEQLRILDAMLAEM